MKLRLSIGWKVLAIAPVAVLAVLVGTYEGAEYYTSRDSFCGGTCHIMNEQYVAWQKSKHHALDGDPDKKAGCIDGHFLPGGKRTFKAKMQAARHLAAYLYDRDAPMPIRTVVKDGACLQSGCHAIEKFQDKEIQYGEKSTFKHKAHFEKEMLKGQKLFCDTCHMKYSAARHFEVPKDICFTCHFRPGMPQEGAQKEGVQIAGPPMPIKASLDEPASGSFGNGSAVSFNTGANKCSLCHKIPTKSLQQQLSADDADKKPITHQTLEAAGVPCESCHLHEVAGSDEIKIDECLDCHSASAELTSKERDGKLMHDAHVTGRRADCLECHQASRHGVLADYLDAVGSVCTQCHSDSHRFQRMLLAGQKVSENISPVPSLMNAVRTNCAGCHTEAKHSNGQLVKAGSAETCAKCHTPEHRKMLDDWKKALEREVKFTQEIEVEALEALAAAEDKLGADKLQEARQMIATGQELLGIVQIGNGVHNKKYAIMILDEAVANFEDTIDLLDSGN